MITNSGSDRNSICWQEHDFAVKVAAGTRTPDEQFTYVGEVLEAGDQSFSYVCALDAGDDPLEDPRCWIKANPLLGVTMTKEKLAEAVAQAKAMPGKANEILRLNFCCWTDSVTAWMSRPTLERVLAHFDPRQLAGREACASVDLSGSQDLTALGVCVPTGTVTRDRAQKDGSIKQVELRDDAGWALDRHATRWRLAPCAIRPHTRSGYKAAG